VRASDLEAALRARLAAGGAAPASGGEGAGGDAGDVVATEAMTEMMQMMQLVPRPPHYIDAFFPALRAAMFRDRDCAV
jgi:hypothetical protein